MSRLIRNEECKKISNREELQDIIKFRDGNTEVIPVYAKETCFKGIPLVRPNTDSVSGQVNIFDMTALQGIRKDNKVPADVSDEALSDCMKENGLLLTLPRNDRMVSIPVCNVAMGSIGDRINLRGRGMYAVEETKMFEPYTPDEKALIGNLGLAHNKGLMQVVMQDETIVTMRSSEYSHISVKGIIEGYEEAMQAEFAEVKFLGGYIDRVIMMAEYELIDKAKNDYLAMRLRQLGFEVDEVHTYHRIVTSDVGESAVKIYSIHDLGAGRKIVSSQQATLVHNRAATAEKFRDKTCKTALLMLTEAEKTLEKLANIEIRHPGGCFRNIASKMHLPKEASLNVSEEFAAMYISGCSALDVYCNLFSIIAEKERQQGFEFDKQTLFALTEKISKAMLMDFELSDIEFEWKD